LNTHCTTQHARLKDVADEGNGDWFAMRLRTQRAPKNPHTRRNTPAVTFSRNYGKRYRVAKKKTTGMCASLAMCRAFKERRFQWQEMLSFYHWMLISTTTRTQIDRRVRKNSMEFKITRAHFN
jgi:hypothetical protein